MCQRQGHPADPASYVSRLASYVLCVVCVLRKKALAPTPEGYAHDDTIRSSLSLETGKNTILPYAQMVTRSDSIPLRQFPDVPVSARRLFRRDAIQPH